MDLCPSRPCRSRRLIGGEAFREAGALAGEDVKVVEMIIEEDLSGGSSIGARGVGVGSGERYA
eukprot:2479377-Pleurochrysis_carterae.AAC.1